MKTFREWLNEKETYESLNEALSIEQVLKNIAGKETIEKQSNYEYKIWGRRSSKQSYESPGIIDSVSKNKLTKTYFDIVDKQTEKDTEDMGEGTDYVVYERIILKFNKNAFARFPELRLKLLDKDFLLFLKEQLNSKNIKNFASLVDDILKTK